MLFDEEKWFTLNAGSFATDSILLIIQSKTMNPNLKNTPLKSVVEQVTNNTTSWIGHDKLDNKDIISGQTFTSPSEMDLEAIEVFTNVVMTPGNVVLTLHPFDNQLKTWGPVIGLASNELDPTDSGKWKSFTFPGLHLNKGKTYGFRLESPDSFIGMGEAAVCYHTTPLNYGQEWRFTNSDKAGHSFSYFSLAFKVDIRA